MKKKTTYNPTSLLLYLRSCYGLTQHELARRCRLTPNDICQFELRRNLTIRKLQALADFFHVSVDDLYHDRFAAHYDLFSFDPVTGEPIIIEVKSTAGGEEEPLHFSPAEWQLLNCCVEKGVRYELHRVYYVDGPKRRRRSIYSAREILESYQAIPSEYILRQREGAA